MEGREVEQKRDELFCLKQGGGSVRNGKGGQKDSTQIGKKGQMGFLKAGIQRL